MRVKPGLSGSPDLCAIDGCGRQRKSYGLCNTHNERRRKGQSLDNPVGQRGGTCAVQGCGRRHYSLGWCELHYNRYQKHGDPLITLHGHTDRNFWEKVDKTGDCWLWTGSLSNGYGSFWDGQRRVGAHRYAYALTAELPKSKKIYHRCRNRNCVNPDHLRLATSKQNSENRVTPNSNNKSGVRGVYWDKSNGNGRWHGQVGHQNGCIFVGYFLDLAEAEAAVIAKRNELFTHNDRDRVG